MNGPVFLYKLNSIFNGINLYTPLNLPYAFTNRSPWDTTPLYPNRQN